MASDKDISLGEFLRQERERRGITIEQVASATKVGVRTLHSLEADHYSDLPAKPFIRGFVTSYCRFIGLDPKETLVRFDEFIDLKGAERPNRESGHSGYAFEKKDGEQQSRTILLIAMCTFVVLGGIAMIFFKPSLRHHRSSHLDKLRAMHQGSEHGNVKEAPSPLPSLLGQVLVQPSSTPVVSPSDTPIPAKSVTQTSTPQGSTSESSNDSNVAKNDSNKNEVPGANPADPLDSGLDLKANEIQHKVILKTMADIWVRFQVDDRPLRKFIVRQGKTLILRAKNTILVQVSHPESVSVKVGTQNSQLMSKAKGVVTRNGNATLFFPSELAEKIEKPFGNAAPLPKTVSGIPDRSSQTQAPSP